MQCVMLVVLTDNFTSHLSVFSDNDYCDLFLFRNARMYYNGKQDARSRHLKAFAEDVVQKLHQLLQALQNLEVCMLLSNCLVFCYYEQNVTIALQVPLLSQDVVVCLSV